MNVLITGGSRGIGKAIVEYFECNGHTVFAPTRSELDLADTINLSNPTFDIVINNAGINTLKNISEISDNIVWKINYEAAFNIIQQCLPYMASKGYGRIVNIGSIWIDIAKPMRASYSASKSALFALTKSITAEYASQGILANTISPGFIATDLTYQNNTTEQIEAIKSNIPIGRLGYPHEVAKLVYQMTVDNTFITGQNIIIDGGYTCTAH
jgi:3-oxoacyl-[acyl-carrier protein] reductase